MTEGLRIKSLTYDLWLTEAFKGRVARTSVPVYVLRSSSRKTSEQARGLAELSRKSSQALPTIRTA
jgi:hypothetical protein